MKNKYLSLSKTVVFSLMFFVLMSASAFKNAENKASKRVKKVITIVNKSAWDIDHIYISAVDNDEWGDDLLGADEIMTKGEAIKVEIDCGTWDVKIVAEDGEECVVENINLCASDIWNADC